MFEQLAIDGGVPAVSISHPHYKWPPNGLADELDEIAKQRNLDITIKGKSGPILEFENAFKQFLDNKIKHTVSFNSGTSALLAAYFAIGISEGDEILGPSVTYHAALSPAYMLKANIKLVDIDINSRCIDPNKIEANITPKTKAITVVHQWGHPADMDAIMDIAKRHNLKVIEDCSHAHGSKYKGQFCGTFGDVAAFSLQANKAIFAGEGGILVTNNDLYHDRATLLGHYRDRSKSEVKDLDLQQYWVTGFGLKLRMSPFNAIVARHALKHFPEIEQGRHKCLQYLTKRLAEIEFIVPTFISNDVHMGAWYGYKPLYKKEKLNNLPRHKLIEILKAEGVHIKVPSGPLLATLPLYNTKIDKMFPERKDKQINHPEDYPVALQVQEEALSIPAFYNWEQHREIIDQYIEAFKKVANYVGSSTIDYKTEPVPMG